MDLASWRRAAGASLAVLALLALPMVARGLDGDPQTGRAPHRPGQVLVKFKAGATRAARERAHAGRGGKVVKRLHRFGVERVKVRKGASVEEAVAEYALDPNVEWAEPDRVYRVQATPNDPLFPRLWGLHNAGQTGGTPDADIDAPEAWDLATGSREVVVGVIDTGIDATHEDLAANLWVNDGEIPGNLLDDDGNGWADDVHGVNAIDGSGNPRDDHGHGTHVAGTIGATGQNGVGVVGVSWAVRVASCKFLDSRGSGYDSDAVECLSYFLDLKERGVNVVLTSNSWGGGPPSRTLDLAIREHEAAGILFVAAAGNDGRDIDLVPAYPAAFRGRNVVAVAATDHADALAGFSNYGSNAVALAAPGVDVVSLRAAGTDMYADGLHFVPEGDPNARYYRSNGTSMATPHVSGVAALLAAAGHPWWEVRNLLLAGADPVPALQGITATGGRLNARNSLACQDRPVFQALLWPAWYPEYTPGAPATLEVLSVDCAAPLGPVVATTQSGDTVELRDDGVAPDALAGDGVFAASWTPTRDVDAITFASPAGTAATGRIPAFEITNGQLPRAKTLTRWEHVLQAAGGVRPFTFELFEPHGTVPGLVLERDGRFHGEPTEANSYWVSVLVRDAEGTTIMPRVALEVADAPAVPAWSATEVGTPTRVAVDAQSNVFSTLARADPTSSWSAIPWLQKRDAAGALLWERQLQARMDRDIELSLALAPDGSAVVGVDGAQGSVRKYSPAGEKLWEHPLYGCFGVAVDAAGSVRTLGLDGLLTFAPDGTPVVAHAVPSLGWNVSLACDAGGGCVLAAGGGPTVTAVRMERDGAISWQRTLTLPWSRVVNDAVVDAAGFTSLAGTVYGPAGATWAHAARLDPAGNVVWQREHDTYGQTESGNGVAVDPDGNVLVVGAGPQSQKLVTYLPDGSLGWEWNYSPTGRWYNAALGVAFGADGRAYVAAAGPFGGGFVTAFEFPFLHIPEPGPLHALPGQPFSFAATAMYGTPPLTWSAAPAAFAPGLSLDPATGVISGAGTDTGSHPFRLRVADATGRMTSRDLVAVGYGPVQITTASLPAASVGTPYAAALAASGGAPPYTWSVARGALPGGLALDGATGRITGTPTRAGTWTFAVTATSQGGYVSGTRELTLATSQTATHFAQSTSGTGGVTYATAPQVAKLLPASGDTATGDAISMRVTGGPQDLLLAYVPRAGYTVATEVSAAASGNAITFLSRHAAGTAHVHLVQVDPTTPQVTGIIASTSASLGAGTPTTLTNLSALRGTVQAGYTVGVLLSVTTAARSTCEVRWGKTNGGAAAEQWIRLTEQPLGVPTNHYPNVEANGPYSGSAGSAIAFSSAGTHDPDLDPLTYLWDFGDGTSSTAPNPMHAYAAAGDYLATLYVSDGEAYAPWDYAEVSVADGPANRPPVANAGPDVSGRVNRALAFSGAGSSDPDGTIVSWRWDFGDGATASGVSVKRAFAAAGTYTVTLTVTDDRGATATDTAVATVK